MYLFEAADTIRDRLIEHQVSRSEDLWETILKQIKKQDSFDGKYVEPILEVIRTFLSQLDDDTTIALWRTTETGCAYDSDDDWLIPDDLRFDLEMELLKEVTDLAWSEARRRA